MNMKTSLPPNIHRTNHVPSPEERVLIQSLISLHQERSLALDAQVKHAEATLQNLLLEQQVQRDLLEAHQALLTAPMRGLIPDVLLEIFRHCHDDARDAPMRLARICRRWRELALSTPTLWSTVTLHGALPTTQIVPFARACANHSGSCDLKVLVNLMTKRPDTQRVQRALVEALQILAQHGHRWRSFEAFMNYAYRPMVGDILISAAPRLERLIWVIEDAQTPLPFSSFPNLRDLRSMLHPRDIPPILQCTKLRNFTAGGFGSGFPRRELTLVDCWTILSNCPSLETFDVSGIKLSQDHDDMEHKGRVVLPCLRVLRLGPFVPDPAPLVHCLITPALTQLRLLNGRSTDFDSSCVRRLVDDCRPPLTSLSLVDANCADVASCLPLLPRLESLQVQQSSTVDLVILRLLERDTAGSFLCPDLEHLNLRLNLFTGAHLIKLAEARRAASGGLRVLLNGTGRRHVRGEFEGLTIELDTGELSDAEVKELQGLRTS